MWPFHIDIFGLHLAVWDVAFLAAVIVGYAVLRLALASPGLSDLRTGVPTVRLLAAYVVTVYVASLGAQLFSYAFDYGTTLLPPPGMSAWRYYLHPVAGPKTLYGCILALPIAIMLVRLPPVSLPVSLQGGLDLWTPPMLSVLATVRMGCFLQGCCYGVTSSRFGLRFPEGSIVYAAQVNDGTIEPGQIMVAVVPAQLFEAVFLVALVAWSYRALRRGRERVFVVSVGAYSVFRFLIEFVRADPARNHLGPFSTSQWMAVLIVTSIVVSKWSRARTTT